MKLKRLLESDAVARTNALKQQQELIDAGYEVKVTKHGDIYELEALASPLRIYVFCLPTGQIAHGSHSFVKSANNSDFALLFAREILKGPFPAGEAVIAKDANNSYRYAKYVLNAPFPAGEEIIATDAEYSYFYANLVLKAPFPAGEPIIARFAFWAFVYAENVLKGPFPAGEKAIKQDPMRYKEYKRLLNEL